MNMLPLRIPVDSVMSTAELADRINAQVWELQARQRFAFGDIVAAVQESVGRSSDAVRRHLLVSDSSR